MLLNAPPEHSTSLRDKLAFARYFEYSVNLPADRCVDRLMELAQPKRGIFNAKGIEVRRGTADRSNQLQVLMRRYQRGAYTTAWFKATILDSPDPKATRIQGKFAIGLIIWLPLVFWLFLSFVALYGMDFGYSAVLFVGLIMLINFAVYAWQARNDYRVLKALIAEALE